MSRKRGRYLGSERRHSLTVSRTGIAFRGPLPPPHILRGYEEVVPGAAERILAMAEKQSHHRLSLEALVTTANVKAQVRGQWMAFVLATLVVGAGGALLWLDRSLAGFVAILSAVAGLAAVFLGGRWASARERQGKHGVLAESESAGP